MGLKFIPKIESPPTTEFNKAFAQYSRSIRLKAFIEHDPNAIPREGTFVSKFYIPNPSWQPPKTHLAYEEYLFDTQRLWNENVLKRSHYNADVDMFKAIKTLKQMDGIIIRPSDKNLGLTILTKEHYRDLVNEHLSDRTTYNPITENARDLKARIREQYAPIALKLSAQFNDIIGIAKYLKQGLDETTSIPAFHILPKIHKKPIKGRPIAGAVKWITTYPSALLSHALRPHASQCKAVLRDSKSLIPMLESLKIPANTRLVTFDIVALYPNMDTELTISIIDTLNLPMEERVNLRETTRFILENNFVEFDGLIYHQINGMPMGTNAAVELANLFGDRYIDNNPTISSILTKSSLLYKRYIDDLFLIWTGTQNELETLLNALNSIHPRLKFTINHSRESLAFLDLLIRIENETITVSTFQKALNKYLYIPFNSNHPYAAKRGFIKGELIRYARNSTTMEGFMESRALFRQRLINRGYPSFFINDCFKTIKYRDRPLFLKDKERDIDETTKQIYLKIVYCQTTRDLKIGRILHQHIDRINNDPDIKSRVKPIVCFKRSRNLQDLLTTSRFGSQLNEQKRKRNDSNSETARYRINRT